MAYCCIARFDQVDMELISQATGGQWYAAPAKAPRGKYYAQCKSSGKTILMHRVILNLTDPLIEGHHIDNNGLNNKRANLEKRSHRDNIRARWPDKDWSAIDILRSTADEYREERLIAARVRSAHSMTRQGIWKIRIGTVRESPAALEYRRECDQRGMRTLSALHQAYPRAGKFGLAPRG